MKKEKSRRNKREKKSKRKQKYIPQKALFGNGEDYYIYRMSFVEKLTGGALGFLVGAFVCMTFFRNFLLSWDSGNTSDITGYRQISGISESQKTESTSDPVP